MRPIEGGSWVCYLQSVGRFVAQGLASDEFLVIGLPCRPYGAALIAAGAIAQKEQAHWLEGPPVLKEGQAVHFIRNFDASVRTGVVERVEQEGVRVKSNIGSADYEGTLRNLVAPIEQGAATHRNVWLNGSLVLAAFGGDQIRSRSFALQTKRDVLIYGTISELSAELHEAAFRIGPATGALGDLVRPSGYGQGTRSLLVSITGRSGNSTDGYQLAIFDGYRAWLRCSRMTQGMPQVIVLDRSQDSLYEAAIDHFRSSPRLNPFITTLKNPPFGIEVTAFRIRARGKA